jgi:hypothetical protein
MKEAEAGTIKMVSTRRTSRVLPGNRRRAKAKAHMLAIRSVAATAMAE